MAKADLHRHIFVAYVTASGASAQLTISLVNTIFDGIESLGQVGKEHCFVLQKFHATRHKKHPI